MAKHCTIKYLMFLSRNDMFVFSNMFKFVLMRFLRPLELIKFRKRAIIAVITLSVHHTFALPANTGHSPNAVSMLSTVSDAGSTFKLQPGENAQCFLG